MIAAILLAVATSTAGPCFDRAHALGCDGFGLTLTGETLLGPGDGPNPFCAQLPQVCSKNVCSDCPRPCRDAVAAKIDGWEREANRQASGRAACEGTLEWVLTGTVSAGPLLVAQELDRRVEEKAARVDLFSPSGLVGLSVGAGVATVVGVTLLLLLR